jgi:CheY-like chemotaxis protein
MGELAHLPIMKEKRPAELVPDVMLMDTNMPATHGVDITRRTTREPGSSSEITEACDA